MTGAFKKILTIDDEKGIRDSFRNFLEDYNYQVLSAKNGKEGIQLIQEHLPDLVLTDLVMPEVNGFEVLEWVKSNRPDLPVITISGAGMINDALEALHRGAWDYILKPVHDLDILLYSVKKCLERSKLIAENQCYQRDLEIKIKEKTSELQESEDQLASIIRTIPDIIYRLTPDGNISYISQSIEKYGYTTNNLLGKNIFSIVHPDDVEKAVFHIDERRTGSRKSQAVELRLLTWEQCQFIRANNTLPLTNNFLFNHFLVESEGIRKTGESNPNEISVIQGIARDITSLKREETEKIQAREIAIKYEVQAKDVFTTSQERFRNLLEASFDGIAFHKQGVIFEVNKGFCNLFSFNKSDIIGKNIFNYIPDNQKERIKAAIERSEDHHYEGEVVLDNGITKYFEVVGAAHSYKGESVRIIGIRDITEKKQSEKLKEEFLKTLENKVEERTRSLNEKNDKLTQTLKVLEATQKQLSQKEKMAALGSLVFGISHEVNTPLGICITAASHLASETAKITDLTTDQKLKKSDFKQFLKTTNESSRLITTNLQKTADLIQQFKKISVDSTSENLCQFNLKEHIDLILLAYHEKVFHNGHQFHLDCSPDLILNSYPSSYTQIFTHLIDNTLVHGFSELKNREIFIVIKVIEHKLVIHYSDNGKGIQPGEAGKVFDPFFTTKRNIGYTGLGLHIIANIIALKLSGTIECIRNQEEGVSFLISVPLDPSV